MATKTKLDISKFLANLPEMIDDMGKGKIYNQKGYQYYEKHRKKILDVIKKHFKKDKVLAFRGKKYVVVFSRQPDRQVLDEEKLKLHFGGIIPDEMYCAQENWKCDVELIK